MESNESSVEQQPQVDADAIGPAKTKRGKKSQEEKAEEKKNRVAWASSLKLHHVVLTDDKTDVEFLAGREWKDVMAYMREAFMKVNNIAIPQNLRHMKGLGKAIANHMAAGPLKQSLMAQNRSAAKKKSPLTKPDCVTKDGTLFRVVNVLPTEQGRVSFKATRKSHDKTWGTTVVFSALKIRTDDLEQIIVCSLRHKIFVFE